MKNQELSLSAIRIIRDNHILRNVYAWMTGGLALTGIIAIGISNNNGILRSLTNNPIIFFGIIILEFILVIFLSSRVMSLNPTTAAGTFVLYAILNGLTISVIFIAYTSQSIALAFFTAAGTFAGTSLWGFTTKRDLSTIGSYTGMALWGSILATLINFFLRNQAIDYLISLAGVAVFVGLTAYDTQKIKRWTNELGTNISEIDYLRISIRGALILYLDFINLFLFLLRIFGRRK